MPIQQRVPQLERKSAVNGINFSLVAAYVEGQLVAPIAYQQIMDSTLFEAWFEHFLMPYLTEKSLIIMDNTRFIEYLY